LNGAGDIAAGERAGSKVAQRVNQYGGGRLAGNFSARARRNSSVSCAASTGVRRRE
jgi:hypothetical protein